MFASLCKFFSKKIFYKQGEPEPSQVRNNDSNVQLYGKRIKLSNQDSTVKDIFITSKRLPMQAKENVKVQTIENDDEGCCVIAEIPRRKKMEPSFKFRWTSQFSENNSKKRHHDSISENNLNDIEIVKHFNYKWGRDEPEKFQNKNYKFFKTHRTPLTPSRAIRSKMSYNNQLKKKINFLQESYRLNEKYQYIQLLKSQTSCSGIKSKTLNRGLPLTHEIPIIDLTEEEPTTKSNNEKLSVVNKVLSEPILGHTPGEQDIEIIKEIPDSRSTKNIVDGRSTLTKKPVFEKVSSELLPNEKQKIEQIKQGSTSVLPVSKISKCEPNKLQDENGRNKNYLQTLETKLCQLMKINDSEIVETCTTTPYVLPILTSEQEKQVQSALIREPSDEILVKKFSLSLTRRDMHTLKGLNWLNDEIINFYMNLIIERSVENKTLPKVYAFNTFFFTKLFCNGYSSLKRWTKHVDIFTYDMLFIPIHLGMHWCMTMVDFRTLTIKYYDSVGSSNETCLELIYSYLHSESMDKRNIELNEYVWQKVNVKNIPQQMNGSDCGVFSCMFAEHLSRNSPILFTQDHMPFFRKKMVLELLEAKLIT